MGEYIEKLLDLNHPPQRALKMITYLMGAFDRVAVITAACPVQAHRPRRRNLSPLRH